ncbi:hypothetical protein [Corallococcus exiguus]|uniref:hypothetical protein n=1 Tax=Corallococcus exiguus TaxID=83462 RepID=UPI0014949E5B|nr:hypothetical protein [Corallococcus exiguus]NPD27805.1 hypothetical protein [Corallococcus exiguus]
MLRAADRVLSIVLATGHDRVRLSAAKAELEELASVGAAILNEGSDDENEDAMGSPSSENTTFATIDPLKLLSEAVAPHGFIIGAAMHGFVELLREGLPEDCAVFFYLRSGPGIFAVRAFNKAPAIIVLHVNDDVDDVTENPFLHTLGIHATRLRSLQSLDGSSIEQIVGPLKAAYIASTVVLGAPPSTQDAPSVDPTNREKLPVDPSKVAEYASTGQDRQFEQATARILMPMFDWVIPLGTAFSGRQVPDGVMFCSRSPSSTKRPEISHYDCKSKHKNSYELAPSDGDQQERYLDIQRRLEEQGWRGRGVLMFTPDVDSSDIEEKTQKEAWGRVLAEERELIFIPARVLLRWWELQSREEYWRLQAFMSPELVWSALFDGRLPGTTDAVARRLLPTPRRGGRVLDEKMAEMIWLAGLHGFPQEVAAVAASLQEADPDGPIERKLKLPTIMMQYVEALSKKGATLKSLANATGLHDDAVEYLLLSRTLTNQISIGLGAHLGLNLEHLRDGLNNAPAPNVRQ